MVVGFLLYLSKACPGKIAHAQYWKHSERKTRFNVSAVSGEQTAYPISGFKNVLTIIIKFENHRVRLIRCTRGKYVLLSKRLEMEIININKTWVDK